MNAQYNYENAFFFDSCKACLKIFDLFNFTYIKQSITCETIYTNSKLNCTVKIW